MSCRNCKVITYQREKSRQYRRDMAEARKEIRDLKRQRELLADAISCMVVDAGIYLAGDFSGPQLLMACDDMLHAFNNNETKLFGEEVSNDSRDN